MSSSVKSARTWLGFQAEMIASRNLVSGTPLVGGGCIGESFTAADIVRSCKAVLTYAGGTAQAVDYDPPSGQLTAAAGSPAITDSALDFEGRTTDAAGLGNFLMIERTDTAAGTVTLEMGGGSFDLAGGDEIVLRCSAGALCGILADTITATYNGSTGTPVSMTVRFSFIGQTTTP